MQICMPTVMAPRLAAAKYLAVWRGSRSHPAESAAGRHHPHTRRRRPGTREQNEGGRRPFAALSRAATAVFPDGGKCGARMLRRRGCARF